MAILDIYKSIGSWFIKLVGGWLPIGTKPLGEWLGKLIWVIGIIGAVLFVYNKFMQPTHRTNQSASNITNIYHQESPTSRLGCASLKVIEYYAKLKESEM